ncbi:MAG TPA: hypothetical protein VMT90_10425 [Dehalococcoidia bacterium]|jgi:hypothetical protein|nr:hypothetical protein [Dehalococcoidia bacterium]
MIEAGARQPITLPLIGEISQERQQTIAICAALVAVVFCVYWIAGPRDTGYSYQTSQANNILHGHLDLVPQYTYNYQSLERVLYDGQGFCFQPGDPEAELVTNPRFSADCKVYMQHSFGPAFLVMPLVVIFGVNLNQALVSTIIGALTAPIVFLVARTFSTKLLNQLVLTGMMMFGTIFWWVASNGGVWFFAHTTATFFLFAAIYFALVRPNPFLAGLLLGCAYMCRPSTLFTGMFFVIVFLPLWLDTPTEERPGWRIHLAPIVKFAAGLAPLLFLGGMVNYLRFDNPLESGYTYGEQFHQDYLQPIFNKGTFDLSYVSRHPPVLLEQMPLFSKPGTLCSFSPRMDCAPVRLSWAGLAIWATTPVFLVSMFTGISNKWVSRAGAVAIAYSCIVIFLLAFIKIWDAKSDTHIPYGLHLLPFWAMIGAAIYYGLRNRDRLVIACWAAIIPTAFLIFNFGATGWSQFGYRYAMDFTPFLWVLVARFIGDRLRWWLVALIAAGVAVNLMGVLWTYQFDPNHFNDWVWVTAKLL